MALVAGIEPTSAKSWDVHLPLDLCFILESGYKTHYPQLGVDKSVKRSKSKDIKKFKKVRQLMLVVPESRAVR